ncbi:MAG: phosphonate C-P lyase system protein PhnH [Pseudomonadota bacterium]
MNTQALDGGFTQPEIQAAYAFRGIMDAFARPGTIQQLDGANPPAPLSVASGACLLTLCDTETPVYLSPSYDQVAVREWIAFHTGAPIVERGVCSFAVGRWDELQPLGDYAVGTAEYPDRSATLIVELDTLEPRGATLAGPGIRDTAQLSLPDVAAAQANHRLYPLGLDIAFTCEDRIAALPRSVEVR